MHEIKELIEKQTKAVAKFKEASEIRMAALEARGTFDPLLEEKVDRLVGKLGELQKNFSDYERRNAKRPRGLGDSGMSYEQKKAFTTYLKTGDGSELKSMNTITGSEGGFTVPEQLDAQLNKYLHDSTPMRQLARVVQSYTADYKIAVNAGGLAAGWVGEMDARPETDTPDIVQVAAPTAELYAFPMITQQLIDDAGFDIEGWLMGEIQGKFSALEGGAFITGNANKQPSGILNYPTSTDADSVRPFGTIKHTVTAGSTTIVPDEVIDLTTDLRGPYRAGAVWLMNSTTAGHIRKLKNANTAEYVWQPALSAGQPPMLAGYRVVIDESMPDIAAGAYPVAFGDFGLAYTIVDRSPLRLLRDAFTAKPNVGFYATKRVSGMVTDSCAFRLLKMKP